MAAANKAIMILIVTQRKWIAVLNDLIVTFNLDGSNLILDSYKESKSESSENEDHAYSYRLEKSKKVFHFMRALDFDNTKSMLDKTNKTLTLAVPYKEDKEIEVKIIE